MSIMFNEICINEEMLPKYTHMYIYKSPIKSNIFYNVTFFVLERCQDFNISRGTLYN